MKALVSFIVLVLLTIFKSFGQPDTPPPNPVPITGIEILLASGGAYGIYRLTRKGSRHKKN
jgi:hypothetical protein